MDEASLSTACASARSTAKRGMLGLELGARSYPRSDPRKSRGRPAGRSPAYARFARTRLATGYSSARRSRSALAMTDTELKLMAALAIIGLSSIPSTGYNTPAAIGTPNAL